MAQYALIIFFLLFGILGLVETKLPTWILPVVALAVAVALIVSAAPWKRPAG